jgi:hypothetical protein
LQATTRGAHGHMVADFGLDGHNVRQDLISFERPKG